MAEVEIRVWVAEASRALVAAAASAVLHEPTTVPRGCGLYAVHARPAVWEGLGLGVPPDERPLYVGKSESNLAGRDVREHFGFTSPSRRTSVTGYSTVRRSIAALLHDSLGFRGVPRNPQRPGNFANYGLSCKEDELLSTWMRERLLLATWPKPPDCSEPLEGIERIVFRQLLPPLNINDVITDWKPQIDTARRVMRLEARSWAR